MAMMLLAPYLNFNSGNLTNTSSHTCCSCTCQYFYLGMVIYLYKYCISDGPGNVLVLPAHYAEIVQRHLMTSDVMMVMIGDGAFMYSLNLSAKVLPDPHVFFITFHLATPEL